MALHIHDQCILYYYMDAYRSVMMDCTFFFLQNSDCFIIQELIELHSFIKRTPCTLAEIFIITPNCFLGWLGMILSGIL